LFNLDPNAKVILTVSDSDEIWWQNLLSYSRYNRNASAQPKSAEEKNILKQLDQFLPRYYNWDNDKSYEKSLKELENMQDLYKQAYRKHIIYVRALIPKRQLLEWNVKEGWGPICKFLKAEKPKIPFPAIDTLEDAFSHNPNIISSILNDVFQETEELQQNSTKSGERPSLIYERTKQRPRKGGNFM